MATNRDGLQPSSRGGLQPSHRGGLQPTPEERNARDTLERLKDKVETLIVQMENTLAINTTSTSALQRRIKTTEKAWTEFEGQYDRLRAITGKGRPQDQVQAEQDRTNHATLQRRYLEVHARAEDALDNDQDAEDVSLKALTSERKVQQHTARWKGVHLCIDRALEEIKASLEGAAIDSLEVLKVKEDQLVQVNESLKESASLVELLIVEDPERINELMESEDAMSLQAASTIHACEERLARF